jgi:hypothetical protein
VIGMSVGQEYFLYLEVSVLGSFGKFAGPEAGIYRSRLSAFQVPDQVAEIPVSAQVELQETGAPVGIIMKHHLFHPTWYPVPIA